MTGNILAIPDCLKRKQDTGEPSVELSLLPAEIEFVDAVLASQGTPGQMMMSVLYRYREHNQEQRSALTMALVGALATRIAMQDAERAVRVGQ